ncbi:MAG TPA: FAD-dependent oxidoreductase, partial [Gemmatimonadaceae bacterium]|nr:FAD-dependent oxidoreductase [Gemmatimonadaceae bacterium]
NERLFATFPDTGDGVKVGVHHEGEITTPATVRRTTTAQEDEEVRALTASVIPAAAGKLLEARVCLYTNTPDHHFLIDRHPGSPAVILASPCSGHGFKFASVIGEILADLCTDRAPAFDLSPFSLTRFSVRGGPRLA